jgi:NADPH:quinone reductase-like Zn-dependent oxidoreductase
MKYEEAPRPKPQAGEILIQVRAAGVNPLDWKVRQGDAKELLKHALSLIPGWDASGVVMVRGCGVQRLKPGDEVYSFFAPQSLSAIHMLAMRNSLGIERSARFGKNEENMNGMLALPAGKSSITGHHENGLAAFRLSVAARVEGGY